MLFGVQDTIKIKEYIFHGTLFNQEIIYIHSAFIVMIVTNYSITIDVEGILGFAKQIPCAQSHQMGYMEVAQLVVDKESVSDPPVVAVAQLD